VAVLDDVDRAAAGGEQPGAGPPSCRRATILFDGATSAG
jgi:hypothetical protein